MSTSYEMYDGQPPDSTAFIPHSSDRTAAPLRDRTRCPAAAACTGRLARPSGALGRRDCPIVFLIRDTVERVLNRFLRSGLATLPQRKAPGWAPTVTPERKAALLRVIELDPPTVGGPRATWTTSLRATYLAPKTHITVSAETGRLYLRAAG